jgi:CubicO group peptidase (beta-lactamase class C family)
MPLSEGRKPMQRLATIFAVLLVLAVGGPTVVAQVETPVPALPATPPAMPPATPTADLIGVAPLPLTGERRATFEAYVADAINRFGVPGASVAVVQAGEVDYAQGFGVRALGGTNSVTPDTLMMIGSVTKSMTSTMAATVVDDGWLSWDTPLVELLPDFAVADPQLTPRLTLADAFCACTGLPRRDMELIFHFNDLTPDRLIDQTATLSFTAPYGQEFQYNNQLYAIGGYAAAAAAGAAPNDLSGGYQLAMRQRLLNPIGMHRSTFALEEVLALGDYALPHAPNLDGQLQPVSPLVDERFAASVAPAGALWSSARDMARYLQMELAGGVAPNGTRVVSAENLARTRAPRVAIPAEPGLPPLFAEVGDHYAMGWVTGTYHGQPIISHSGGTLGFGSEVAFLPEADLGIVILTNGGQAAGVFNLAVQFRLLELLFDQPAEFDALLGQFLEAQTAQVAELQAQLGTVDLAAVAPYLGRYENSALGEVEVALRDGGLVFDVGEVRSEMRPQVDAAGQVVGYVFTDPPLAGPTPVTLRRGDDGQPEVALTVAGEAEETYVFSFLGPSLAATPTP